RYTTNVVADICKAGIGRYPLPTGSYVSHLVIRERVATVQRLRQIEISQTGAGVVPPIQVNDVDDPKHIDTDRRPPVISGYIVLVDGDRIRPGGAAVLGMGKHRTDVSDNPLMPHHVDKAVVRSAGGIDRHLREVRCQIKEGTPGCLIQEAGDPLEGAPSVGGLRAGNG